MATSNPTSPFSEIQAAPPDAILGIKQAFLADPKSKKADLSVGIYQNAEGKTPNLGVVKDSLERIAAGDDPAGYLPIDGLPAFNAEIKRLLFGQDSRALQDERIVTAQSLGGTGALRYGGDFIRRYFPNSAVYLSDPTWANHTAIFKEVGLEVKTYPYLDKETYGVKFQEMCDALSKVQSGSIVLLHASCHNPTGIDPSPEQWDEIISILKHTGAVPFLDFAYQGFAEGIEEDASVPRKFVDQGMCFLLAQSCSKNFSLYRRRVGSLSIVCADKDEASRVLSQLKTIIRTNNSNPPFEGAAAVSMILSDPALRVSWENEVSKMRTRIREMRSGFVELLQAQGLGGEFEHIVKQNGMFSFSGLTREHVLKLREHFGVYLVESSRMCVAALTPANIEHVAESVAKVVKGEV